MACEFGPISTLAAATLRELGYTQAAALDRGIKAWRPAPLAHCLATNVNRQASIADPNRGGRDEAVRFRAAYRSGSERRAGRFAFLSSNYRWA